MNSEILLWRLNSALAAEGLPFYYTTVSKEEALPRMFLYFVHSKILLAFYSVFASKQ